MSSESDLSWCTTKSEFIALDKKDLKSTNPCAKPSESHSLTRDNNAQGDQYFYQTDMESQCSANICCFDTNHKLIERTKKLNLWNMPWIIILIGVAQVCMIFGVWYFHNRFQYKTNIIRYIFF